MSLIDGRATTSFDARGTSSLQPPPKPQRVLACVLCQQRKVKCDRKFPCANCLRSHTQCVPAIQLPRSRRRRLPTNTERSLLDRLRKYEDLLRQNNIEFEPFNTSSEGASRTSNAGHEQDSEEEQREVPSGLDRFTAFWHAMREGLGDEEDEEEDDLGDREVMVVKTWKTWNQEYLDDDLLLFGSRQTNMNLRDLHPEPGHTFQLWQLFLDNINPLLRVVHVPTMQRRVIDAVSNIKSMTPITEALMFSIYSIATMSLGADECQVMFGSAKQDLLTKYQVGCRQALVNCGFLRCNDRDCLTALFLYLVSLATCADARALCSMLGLVVRLAQRMGIDSEAQCAKSGVFEGEMRRRLWWALVIFDSRISQLADFKTQMLTPTWDCNIPLNVNDTDLRPEMKEPPIALEKPTEAIRVVALSALADFARNSTFLLGFNAPLLKPLARKSQGGVLSEMDELQEMENSLENNYLKFCSLENPIQCLTIWETRSYLAKNRLMLSYANTSANPNGPGSEAQVDTGVSYALRLLECNTNIMTSPLTRPYQWMAPYNFPFPAYIHLAKYLKQHPLSEDASIAWEVMSDNCAARFTTDFQKHGPFFEMFAKLIFHAWEPREMAAAQSNIPATVPRIILKLREIIQQNAQDSIDSGNPNSFAFEEGEGIFPTPPTELYEGHDSAQTFTGEDPDMLGSGVFYNMQFDPNHIDWAGMDWNLDASFNGATDAVKTNYY